MVNQLKVQSSNTESLDVGDKPHPWRESGNHCPVLCVSVKRQSVPEQRSGIGGFMHFQDGASAMRTITDTGNGHVQEVVRQAHDELRQLLQQRAEVMRRIGTIKQTIAGLANLFGDGVLSDELLELVDRKSSGRQPGFTKACRMILMDSKRALSARDVCDRIQEKVPPMLARHKDPDGFGDHGAQSSSGVRRGRGRVSRQRPSRLAVGRRFRA